MDVGEMIKLYVELGDDSLPIPRLRRVLEHLGIGTSVVAVAALINGAGPPAKGGILAVLAALVLLAHGLAMVLLSVWVARGPARRGVLARAIARASLVPFLLIALAGLLGQGERGTVDDYST